MRVPTLGLPIVLRESERREKVRPPVATAPAPAPSAIEEGAAAARAGVEAEEKSGGGDQGGGFGKWVAEKGFGFLRFGFEGFGLGRTVGIWFRIGKGFGVLRGKRGVDVGW